MQRFSHHCQSSQTPLKKNKFFHDGWSPIFITLRAQLICMINIRQGLCGYRHVLRDEDSRTHNITVLVARWKAIVDRFTFESEEAKEEIMSWTGTPPEFWLNSETQDRGALLEKLCEDIIHIQETIKGRKKAEFRRLISHYTRLRERNFQRGKIGAAIRSVSGKTVNTYDMKFLRIDKDTSMADEDEILEKMRDWFEAWHRGEAKYRTGIHAPDTDWLAVYEDRSKFMEMTLECGANDELRGLI